MKTNLRHAVRIALAVTALAAAGAQAAEMTIYGRPGFEGRSYTLDNNANLADINFQNRVSSLIIHSGVWEVCTDRDLRGDCVLLRPGRYAELDSRLNDRIESMRVLDRQALRERDRARYDDRYRDDRYRAGGAGVEIWTQPNFAGKHVRLTGETHDLTPHGIQDQAASIVVHDGKWEFCTQPNFRGSCEILTRGTYPTLEQSLMHRVESVRQVEREGRDYYGRR
jgi:hypothetical protein